MDSFVPCRNSLLILLIGTFHVSASAQESTTRRSLIAEGYFGFGNGSAFSSNYNLDDWRSALPNSELLRRDIPLSNGQNYAYNEAAYYGYGPYGRFGYSSGTAYMGLGLDLGRNAPDGSKFEKRLRIGFAYTGFESATDSWGTSNTARYDTLVSQSTGAQLYRDTTFSETYAVNASWSRIGLDASYTVRRVNSSRWAWYVGAGAQVGATMNSDVSVSHRTTRSDLNNEELYASYREFEEIESHRLRSNYWGAAYALAGLDFQLSRTSPFLSNLHLFLEMRPTMQFSAPAGVAAQVQGGVRSVFGLRFDLR